MNTAAIDKIVRELRDTDASRSSFAASYSVRNSAATLIQALMAAVEAATAVRKELVFGTAIPPITAFDYALAHLDALYPEEKK